MERKDFQNAFDSIPYVEDFNKRTKQLLLERLETLENTTAVKPKRLIAKKTKTILIAAALIAAFAFTVGAVYRFTMPKEARDFLQLEDSRLTEILADGSVAGVDGIKIEKKSVKTAGQTVTTVGVLDGTAIRADIAAMLNMINNHEDANTLTFTAEKECWAVLTVTADDGGPVLGYQDESELHHHMGCCLCVQGIDPIVWGYAGQFIIVDNVAYLYIPLHDAMMYADRELRICVYGDFAPAYNVMRLNQEDGLPHFNDDYDGIQATFSVDIDDSFADHAAVAAFEEKEPLLPSDWEIAHGLAD